MEDPQITPRMREAMQGASPWMKIIGILFLVIGGLYALSGLLALFASPIAGIVALAVAAVFIFCGINVLKGGNAFGSYAVTGNVAEAEKGMEGLKDFFMIYAIFMITAIVLGIIMYLTVGTMGSMMGL